jgi:hypothetical protein
MSNGEIVFVSVIVALAIAFLGFVVGTVILHSLESDDEP